MKPNRYNVIGTLLLLIGLGLIGWGSSWLVAFGIFILLMGNNIDRSAESLELQRLKRKLGM